MLLDKERIPAVLKPFYEKYRELYEVDRAWKRREIREEHLRSWPLKVFIEPTNRCLMECVYCARKHMERPLGDLSFENFYAILEGLPRGGRCALRATESLCLTLRFRP